MPWKQENEKELIRSDMLYTLTVYLFFNSVVTTEFKIRCETRASGTGQNPQGYQTNLLTEEYVWKVLVTSTVVINQRGFCREKHHLEHSRNWKTVG